MQYEIIHLKEHFPFLGDNGCDPVLGAYIPNNMNNYNGDNTRPGILICPGGGYGCVCSDREGEPIAMKFLSMGFNAFVLGYSTAPHNFPIQLREVAAAMEIINENAEKWQCDPEKIAITGFSAGGHLAAHYSTAYSCPEVREVFPESRPVAATILGYPVITASTPNAHIGSFLNLLGKTELTAEDEEKFSCDRLVTAATPPAFIWHTAEDQLVPVENSLMYAAALRSSKVPFELHIYPFGNHGLATVDRMTNGELSAAVLRNEKWLEDVNGWLKITFGLR